MKKSILLSILILFSILSLSVVFADIPDLAGTNNMTLLAGSRTNANYQNFSEGIYISIENITFDFTSSNTGYSISTWYQTTDLNSFIVSDADFVVNSYLDIFADPENIVNGNLYVETGSSGNPTIDFINISSLLDNNFHNIILTKDGYNYSFYVDGILAESKIIAIENLTGNANNVTGQFILGTDSYFATDLQYTNGLMTQTAIYNKSLNSSEISQIFSNGEEGNTTTEGLIHHWIFFSNTPIPPVVIPPAYQSNIIYQVMNSSGSGLGIFIQILARAIFPLLILLGIVGIIVFIGYSLRNVLVRSGNP